MPAHPRDPLLAIAERLKALEARVAQLEDYVGLTDSTETADINAPGSRRALVPRSAEELELELGQNWFARAGIVALAVGGGFLLTLPYPTLPPAMPAAAGLTAALLLFALAHFGRTSFTLVSSHLRGAAMALLYCAALRFCFFGEHAVLRADTAPGALVLAAAAAVNLVIAWRRHSAWLMGLALLLAATTPLAIGSAAAVLGGCVSLAVIVTAAGARPGWRPLLPFGATLTFALYFIWAIGNPVLGNPYAWASAPSSAPLVLLLCMTIFGVVPLWSSGSDADTPSLAATAALNCIVGYSLLVIHTYAIRSPAFGAVHITAFVACMWIAVVLWLRHRSELCTFFYAMCSYAALSMAIVHFTAVPEVFVWLSVESVMVVATAVWFRSRFIVAANFVIYVAVVLGYIVLNERETGVSIGFGLVALATARILNWQRHRLALTTEFMRNAYLLSAFVVFPYALHHLFPPQYTALSWVGLAVAYYGLNVVIQNQKYRWMAHATLLLTTVYLLIPSHPGLTHGHRIASFLALGAVLLGVSLLFTQSRRRNAVQTGTPNQDRGESEVVGSARSGTPGA